MTDSFVFDRNSGIVTLGEFAHELLGQMLGAGVPRVMPVEQLFQKVAQARESLKSWDSPSIRGLASSMLDDLEEDLKVFSAEG